MQAHERGFFTEEDSVEVVTGRNINAKNERVRAAMAVIIRKSRNAITMGMGDLNMADMAQGALFILACAFLYGLTVFLFRDQIKSRR